jgi:hypothetical protein
MKTNTPKYATQNPECTCQRYRTKTLCTSVCLSSFYLSGFCVVYFRVFVFVLYLWIVHSGFCVVYFGVFVFVLYLWIVHFGFSVVYFSSTQRRIQNVQSRDIERRQTHRSTQHRIQNVQSRYIEWRQTHRSTQHRIQNVHARDIEISLDCTFWILRCVLQCVCLRSISLDCTFWILCCVLQCVYPEK